MGSTTTPKAYPYPTGGDRVMDGDNAIQSLAEALAADGTEYTRCGITGQAVTAGTVATVQLDPPSPNGCGLTRTSATVLTVTKAGLYAITVTVGHVAFMTFSARSYVNVAAGGVNVRTPDLGENIGTVSGVVSLAVGDTITVTDLPNASTSINSGFLHVVRLGRAN